jgi:hypothetical protein
MLSMVFEVIQPDLEINRRHVGTLLIPLQAAVCEPLRAVLWRDSGKFWQRHSGGTRLGLWCRAQESDFCIVPRVLFKIRRI